MIHNPILNELVNSFSDNEIGIFIDESENFYNRCLNDFINESVITTVAVGAAVLVYSKKIIKFINWLMEKSTDFRNKAIEWLQSIKRWLHNKWGNITSRIKFFKLKKVSVVISTDDDLSYDYRSHQHVIPDLNRLIAVSDEIAKSDNRDDTVESKTSMDSFFIKALLNVFNVSPSVFHDEPTAREICEYAFRGPRIKQPLIFTSGPSDINYLTTTAYSEDHTLEKITKLGKILNDSYKTAIRELEKTNIEQPTISFLSRKERLVSVVTNTFIAVRIEAVKQALEVLRRLHIEMKKK